MIVKDKHRMFYRGLVPQVIAFTILQCIDPHMIEPLKSPDQPWTNHIWPFVFVAGTLLVHPFMLLGMRVQCSTSSKTDKVRYLTRNTISCAQYIKKTAGISGFYKGFFPSLIIYSLLSHESLIESYRNSIRMLKK